MVRKASVIFLLLITLSSCQSGGREVFVAENKQDVQHAGTIVFVAGGRYIAEMVPDGKPPTISIPELGIYGLELKKYLGDDGTELFTETSQRINIMLYDGHLVLMFKDLFEDTAWEPKGMLYDFYEKT